MGEIETNLVMLKRRERMMMGKTPIEGSLLSNRHGDDEEKGKCTDLIIIWKADSLPPLHCDGDDQEDAGGEGEVATAFKEWEDEADEAVIEAKVEGKHKKIRKKKEGISNAETREKLVEQIEHGSGMRNIPQK